MWDLASGQCVATLKGHQQALTALAFGGEDGSLLVTVSEDRTAKVWNLFSVVATSHASSPSDNNVNGGGAGGAKEGAADDEDHDFPEGAERQAPQHSAYSMSAFGSCLETVYTGHMDAILSVACSPDGAWIATGGSDQTAKLIRLNIGRSDEGEGDAGEKEGGEKQSMH